MKPARSRGTFLSIGSFGEHLCNSRVFHEPGVHSVWVYLQNTLPVLLSSVPDLRGYETASSKLASQCLLAAGLGAGKLRVPHICSMSVLGFSLTSSPFTSPACEKSINFGSFMS